MPSNIREFERELRRTTRRFTRDELVIFHKRLAFEALRRVVFKTPVDSGRTRGNWQVTLDIPAVGTIQTTDANGAATVARGAAIIEAIEPFSAVFITNNVPHILVLEEGRFDPPDPGPTKDPRREGKILVRGGFSTQAPQGMVAVTVTELRAIFGT